MKKTCKLLLLFFGLISLQQANGGVDIPDRTYLLSADQYPLQLQKLKPSYVIAICLPWGSKWDSLIYKKNTIVNLKLYLDSTHYSIRYRLVYQSNDYSNIDSAVDYDSKFNREFKYEDLRHGILRISSYTHGQKTVEFIFNYELKFGKRKNFSEILWEPNIFNSYDIDLFAMSKVWVLSIGIDDYGDLQTKNSFKDAAAIVDFFGKQRRKTIADSVNTFFLLQNKVATKDSILACFKYIISNASTNDYFIFNFSGFSVEIGDEQQIYFVPHGFARNDFFGNKKPDSLIRYLISLSFIQQQVQLIPCINQLFISEAGNSSNFKTQFIKGLLKDPAVARILNKNRIFLIPNEIGVDAAKCNSSKGPLNYFITSLDSSYNIYNLFTEGTHGPTAYDIKKKQYQCSYKEEEYFEIFSQREYLEEINQYANKETTRGTEIENNEDIVKQYAKKRYAFIVGTDHYNKNSSWHDLANPVYDATDVADELKYHYGFEVKLLKDASMDSIYNSLLWYYNNTDSTDQLVIYFAGHGDYQGKFFQDGFIVCSDSKSYKDDPYRNTYISFSKIKKMINQIPAKQLLVVMDICYGGTFDEEIFGNRMRENIGDNGLNSSVMQKLSEWSNYKSRIILSSVADKPAFDGTAGKHSPFANLLLQGLRGSHENTGGIVTATDIYSLLDQQSRGSDNDAIKITPHKGGFGDNQVLGEFVFIPVKKNDVAKIK